MWILTRTRRSYRCRSMLWWIWTQSQRWIQNRSRLGHIYVDLPMPVVCRLGELSLIRLFQRWITKNDAHRVINLHTVWPRLMLLRLRLQRPNSESCAEFCLWKLSPKFLRWRHVCLINLACLAMSSNPRRVWFTWASGAILCHDQSQYVMVGGRHGHPARLGMPNQTDFKSVACRSKWCMQWWYRQTQNCGHKLAQHPQAFRHKIICWGQLMCQ